MSEIGKRIAAIVHTSLAPHLKAQRFRKRGITFFRTNGDALQVVTVQSSQHNYGDSGKFRVNFGVHFPEVAKVLHGSDRMPKVPSEPYCLLRAIGSVPDRWWMVNPATIAATLASNLGSYWSEVIWPWLEANKHLPEAANTLEGHDLVAAAAARLVLSERDEAVRLVKARIADLESTIQAQSAHPEIVELLTARLKEVREWATGHHLP